MTERRRFSARERAALYLAADGKCTECGRELEPGWHADHETPWSRGGKTDVINGQALCPPCNLKKGNRMIELRPWQEEALDGFLRTGSDFLVVAAPGTGKTLLSLTCAQKAIEMAEIQRVIVVVPTAHLRKQWSQVSVKLGIQLDHLFSNGSGALASDFDGLVVTYAAVASAPLLFKKLATAKSSLIILDEIHHCGESRSWDEATKEAFASATRRLLLSGTPTRTDRDPVPFIHYDDRGMFVANGGHGYTYGYGEAIRDHTVRPIAFLALDGSVRWREAGAIVETDLKDTDDDTLVNALRSALDPDGEWIASVLKRADAELTIQRNEVPDAAGLVIAADQFTARRYAKLLEKITGQRVALAITDEPDSSDRIGEFVEAKTRWLVAVQMVSEGVDIPRLAIGVYASRIRTELFFRQVVGRFVRMRSIDDTTTATLLIPSVEPLLGYAREIEKTVGQALKQEETMLRGDTKERDQQLALRLNLVEPLDSTEAVHHSTILSGEAYTDEELQRAQVIIEASNLPGTVTAAHIAGVLRMAGAGRVVGSATIEPPKVRNLADDKASFRRLINRKVGHLHNMTDTPYSHIHGQLNQLCKDTAPTATEDTLKRRLEILDNWIKSASEVGSF